MMSLLIGTAHAATADPAVADSAFPPFNAVTFPGQIFWVTIVFAVLYILMSRIALPRVEGILSDRAARIDADLAAATAMQEQAAQAGEAYEKTLADARANAQAIGQKAKDEANASADARRKAVEAEMTQKIASAEASIQAARTKAMASVDGIAVDAAADIITRITGLPVKAEDLKKAVQAARA